MANQVQTCNLNFKALNTGHPPYLADLLQYHNPTKSTRSSAIHLKSVPWHNLSFGSRAFRISAPKIWNSLPSHILQFQTLSSFRRHLKTHYFQLTYPGPSRPCQMRPDFLLRLALYISLTYIPYLLSKSLNADSKPNESASCVVVLFRL